MTKKKPEGMKGKAGRPYNNEITTRVYNCLVEKGSEGAHCAKISREIGICKPTVAKRLLKLCNEGKITLEQRIGENKAIIKIYRAV